MANLSFVDAGFVWGLIISLIILCALVTLVVLIIRKKRKTVDIDVVNNSDISAVDSIVLSGGRNYTVGSNNVSFSWVVVTVSPSSDNSQPSLSSSTNSSPSGM